jgi:hypothetical protein
MEGILEHLRSFVVLFLIVMLLIQMVPREHLKKYIRFFGELVLALGFLSPILKGICESDSFLADIAYEEFAEELEQMAKDSRKVQYLKNDYYKEAYENAIAAEVESLAHQCGYEAAEADVALTEQFAMESVYLVLKGEEMEEEYEALRQELSAYYGLEESSIVIVGGGF